jgi:probable F420-dependent oxidoreductase
MEIGCNVESRRPWTNAEAVRTIGTRAEALGYDSLWVSDHVILPAQFESVYPYAQSNNLFTPEHSENYYEAITVLAFLAGATRRPRLGISVLVVPQRPPLITAKQWATLDALSVGRSILGVGAGWLREEFEALGAGAFFGPRGKALDEAIAIYRALMTQPGELSFQGEVYQFAPLRAAPKSPQPGGPPIWVGGHGRRSLRRAAELGDGWQAVRMNLDEFQACRATLDGLLTRYGRSWSELTLSTSLIMCAPGASPPGEPGDSDLFGSPEEMAAKVKAFLDAGVEHIMLRCWPHDSSAPVLEAMEYFARDVRPLLAS